MLTRAGHTLTYRLDKWHRTIRVCRAGDGHARGRGGAHLARGGGRRAGARASARAACSRRRAARWPCRPSARTPARAPPPRCPRGSTPARSTPGASDRIARSLVPNIPRELLLNIICFTNNLLLRK